MLKRLLAVLALLIACNTSAGVTVSFNDPGQSGQWYLDALNFGDAWAQLIELPTRGQVTVAVVDSGFDTNHVDLQANLAVASGINVVDGSKNISAVNPHGTGTIGILAATSGNGEGITQAAWSAEAIPIRVSNRSDGAAYTTHLAAGIRYAADAGARVINVSYSGVQLGILNRAAKYAQSKGAIVFMAAGNDGLVHKNWRNQKFLIAVGATDQGGDVTYFSSRGKFVDLVAPGSNILSLTTKDRTYSWYGTSFSSPIAASVAALMLTANPELAPWQVRNILFSTAVDIGADGKDWDSGFGLIDANAAVALAIATKGRYTGDAFGDPITLIDNDLSTHSGLKLISQLNAVEEVTTGQYGANTVPEPGMLLLMLTGLTFMFGLPRIKRRA